MPNLLRRVPPPLLLAIAFGCTPGLKESDPGTKDEAGTAVVYLDQGWSDDERLDFYFLTQGSRLVPYDWFLALETPEGEELFRSDRHLASLGYIPAPSQAHRNPDKLPIGFVKDTAEETAQTAFLAQKSFLGPESTLEDYPTTSTWLGFTCSACHTANLTFQGKTMRIDGGPAMVDHERFLSRLAQALRATQDDDQRFERFAKRVLEASFNPGEANALRGRLAGFVKAIERLVQSNKGQHPYGFARVDAFGAILNQVCSTSLEIPGNQAPSTAPVSFPFLWNAPYLDWVQWNGSANNPIARNVGEVLGVYSHTKLTGTPETGQFTSTARIDNLFRLEENLGKLTAPAWPEDILGPIDPQKAALGEKLFAENCARCHGLRDKDGQFPVTEPNQAGKQFVRTTMIPAQTIGTDPLMVQNFTQRMVDPGALRPHLPEPFRTTNQVPAAIVLATAVRGTIQNRLATIQPPLDMAQLAALNGYRDPDSRPPNLAAYKARPLDGVWATAPYLHNGSVPSLYQLLLPENQRVRSFFVGDRQFDPKHVGFVSQEAEGAFRFETLDAEGRPIPGNSNAGHSGKRYTQTEGADGMFRDFTEEERWGLVEYLKTLK